MVKPSILDTVNLFLNQSFEEKQYEYDCVEGEIVYFKGKLEDQCLAISSVSLKPEYQKRGLFTSLINKIVSEHSTIEKIYIFQPGFVTSIILLTTLFGGRYFVNYGMGEFIWLRSNKIDLSYDDRRIFYDHQKAIRISDKLAPVRSMMRLMSEDEIASKICGLGLIKYM